MSNARKLADLLDSAGDVAGGKIADDTVNSEHFVDGGIDDAHIGDLAASKLTGTIASARLSASNLGSGTVPTARLGSGTANNAVFLRGDNTWATAGSTSASDLTSGTLPDARFPSTLPAISGANLTGIAATVAALTDATVSSSDPVITTNPSAVGHLWLNSTSGESYVCTTATSNNNVWKNIGGGTGDIQPYSFDPTSPFEYGDGTDGSVSSITVVDTYLTSSSVSAGANTCTVNSATGFASGDQVLIIQVQKASLTTGVFEMLAISGINGSTITFASNFQNAYTSNATNITTQMIRVPNYSAVTLGSTFNVPAWDGNEGGICVIKCSGTFALTAPINASEKGFRGGQSTSVGSGNPSSQGEGQTSEPGNSGSANAAGGGGGRMNIPGSLSAQKGAGGGHAAAGTNGNSNAVGGTAWGAQDLTSHLGFGGGGGAGGYDYSSQGGHGGIGGGIIMIMAATFTISGSGALTASGGNGSTNGEGNGGGAAGGSIYVKSGTFTSNDSCTAAGAGGHSNNGGSVGRIHVQGTLFGTTSPTAYTG